jgi:hypothetical protein
MAKKSGKRTVSEIMKSEKLEEVEKKGKEITQWIEAILKEEFPKSNLRESLLDGVILCKLVNAICPGALKRYHKKPRMLAMKIENIGFFLATCKTRLNLPPALLFQPTDIHDDSNNLASMSKVLNVLSFLKGDGDGGMITGLEDDEDEDEAETPANNNKAGDDDPDIEPPDAHTEEPAPQVHTSKPEPTITTTTKAAPPAASHAELTSADFAEMQVELLKTINDAVNQELSIESKRKLVKILQQQLTSFDEKLINSPDDVLHSILRDVAPDEASKTSSKERQSVVEALNIYSRIN